MKNQYIMAFGPTRERAPLTRLFWPYKVGMDRTVFGPSVKGRERVLWCKRYAGTSEYASTSEPMHRTAQNA